MSERFISPGSREIEPERIKSLCQRRHISNRCALEVSCPWAAGRTQFLKAARAAAGIRQEGKMNNTAPPLRAFKRSPSPALSKWIIAGAHLTWKVKAEDSGYVFSICEQLLAPGEALRGLQGPGILPPSVHTTPWSGWTWRSRNFACAHKTLGIGNREAPMAVSVHCLDRGF
jgi:hypothetical protein